MGWADKSSFRHSTSIRSVFPSFGVPPWDLAPPQPRAVGACHQTNREGNFGGRRCQHVAGEPGLGGRVDEASFASIQHYKDIPGGIARNHSFA